MAYMLSLRPPGPTFSQTTFLANLCFQKAKTYITYLSFLPATKAQMEQWRLTMAIWKSPTCLISMKPCMYPCQRRDDPTTVATSRQQSQHLDITVSQLFRRWMSIPQRRHLERRKGWHTEPLVYRSVSKMATRMGRYRQITCTSPYAGCPSQ
jgi:hypothetical protein